jgi:hypothetical protein
MGADQRREPVLPSFAALLRARTRHQNAWPTFLQNRRKRRRVPLVRQPGVLGNRYRGPAAGAGHGWGASPARHAARSGARSRAVRLLLRGRRSSLPEHRAGASAARSESSWSPYMDEPTRPDLTKMFAPRVSRGPATSAMDRRSRTTRCTTSWTSSTRSWRWPSRGRRAIG